MTQPTISQTKSEKSPTRIPQKITQLQCYDQNLELKDIFISWFSQSFKYLPNVLEKIYFQIQFIVNFIEYRFTVSKDKPQVGDYLQNLKYKNLTKYQKIMFLILDIVLPYMKKRLMAILQKYEEQFNKNQKKQQQDKISRMGIKNQKYLFNKISSKISFVIHFIQRILSFLNFLNLAIFISKGNNPIKFISGQYRTLIQRILKMQMQFVNPENSRVLNFTLMNRTIIWQIYQMVLKNVLPFAYKFVRKGFKNIFYLHSYLGVDENEQQNLQICIFCGENPTMILEARPCGHKGCFYCVNSQSQETIETDQKQKIKQKCIKCNKQIVEWKKLYLSY